MLTKWNLQQAKRYCMDPIDEIEGWFEAETKPGRFELHHKLEEHGYSYNELISKGLYYGRPAEELVFLTQSEHKRLHMKGKPAWNKGKPGKPLSEKTRQKMSESLRGEKNPNYGKQLSEEYRRKISYAKTKHICPALLQMMRYEQHRTYEQMADQLGVARNTIINKLLLLNK